MVKASRNKMAKNIKANINKTGPSMRLNFFLYTWCPYRIKSAVPWSYRRAI